VNCEGLDDVLLVFLCDHGVSPFKKYFHGTNSANGW
jgi:hypothetical protein